jgi:hypothetical protein
VVPVDAIGIDHGLALHLAGLDLAEVDESVGLGSPEAALFQSRLERGVPCPMKLAQAVSERPSKSRWNFAGLRANKCCRTATSPENRNPIRLRRCKIRNHALRATARL